MCEANAYILEEDGKHTMVMEAVDKVEPDEKGIRLVSIFGEQKFIKGRIHALSLVDHRVVIQPE